jgi:DNA-binding NarL/FixJ family response regulator
MGRAKDPSGAYSGSRVAESSASSTEETAASMKKRVLLIDDDPVFIRRVQAAVQHDIDLRVVSVANDAIQTCATWKPDLILLDVHITPGDSFKILDDLTRCALGQAVSVLCLSRGPGSTTHIQSFGDAVFGILKREIDQGTLISTIARALGAMNSVAA